MNELIFLAKKHNMNLQINAITSNSTEMNILNGCEQSFEVKKNTTYLIKAMKGEKCASLLTESIHEKATIIKNLETIFEIQENKNENRLSKGHVVNRILDRTKNDFQKIKEDLLSLELLKQKYPISSIEISYIYYEESNQIYNEEADMFDEYYNHEYAISFTLEKENVKKNFYTCFYSKEYDFEGFKNHFLPMLDACIVKLNSESCATNKYNILLKNDVVAEIVNSFLSMFKASSIYLKQSVLSDKFEKKVFNEKISIIEDPQNKNTIRPKYFDIEGTSTTYKEIVNKGIFHTQLNDLEYAIKLEQTPTGNAGGSVNNLYIKPGNLSYENLIKKLDNGMIIDMVMGLHCGINEKTGAISLQAEGLAVKNGKIVSGLEKVVLTTTIFEILNQVLEVGNDLSKTNLDVLAPSLLLENITIAGEK